MFIAVDLPQPVGPRIEKISASPTWRSSASRASVASLVALRVPYDLQTALKTSLEVAEIKRLSGCIFNLSPPASAALMAVIFPSAHEPSRRLFPIHDT